MCLHPTSKRLRHRTHRQCCAASSRLLIRFCPAGYAQCASTCKRDFSGYIEIAWPCRLLILLLLTAGLVPAGPGTKAKEAGHRCSFRCASAVLAHLCMQPAYPKALQHCCLLSLWFCCSHAQSPVTKTSHETFDHIARHHDQQHSHHASV